MKKFVGPQIAQIHADSKIPKMLETEPRDRYSFLITMNPNLRNLRNLRTNTGPQITQIAQIGGNGR